MALDRGPELALGLLATFANHLLELVEHHRHRPSFLCRQLLDAVEHVGKQRQLRLSPFGRYANRY